MKIKISIPNLIAILVYHIALVTLSHVNSYYTIKYILIFLVGLFLCSKTHLIIDKRFFMINSLVVLYCIFIMISAIYNRTRNNAILSSLIYCLNIIEVFWFWEYLADRNKTNHGISIFYYLSLIYSIMNDVLMILLPYTFSGNDDYLLGNKFSVCYIHLFLVIFYFQKNIREIQCKPRKRIMLFMILGWTILVGLKTECSTGVVACILFLIMYFATNRVKKLLSSPLTMSVILGFFTIVLLLFTAILSNGLVQYVIVDILHEDATLTGRTEIYINIFKVIMQSPYWGYGYGNTYDVVKEMIHAPNAQNGVLNCVISYGIWATSMQLIIGYYIFSRYNKQKTKAMYPIVIYIYIFIILSSVEITLGRWFILLLAILNAGIMDQSYMRSEL